MTSKDDLIPASINDPHGREYIVERDEIDSDQTSLAEEQNKPQSWKALVVLYLVTLIMVLARSVDFVLYIRMAHKMVNYEYFLGDILLSIGFCCVSWPVVWVKMWTGGITKKMREFPSWKFILMGIFDSLSVVISTIPSALVSGPINVVMGQSVVFVNMVASFVFLHFRYTIFHYLGVLLVICGITVDVWPLFASDHVSDSNQFTWLWVSLLFFANIPMAASNVYKEKYLKEAHLDVWYMNAWVAIYQLIFGLLSFPITFIPLPEPATYIKPSELPQYMLNGWKCFAGIDSQPNDQCSFFWLVFLVFIVFNMTYNILMLVVFQRGSSTLAVIASAARLALSNFGFLIPWLAGEAYVNKLTYFDVIALVILIIGIVVYALTKESVATKDDFLRRTWRAITPCFHDKEHRDDPPGYRDDYNASGGNIIYVEN